MVIFSILGWISLLFAEKIFFTKIGFLLSILRLSLSIWMDYFFSVLSAHMLMSCN